MSTDIFPALSSGDLRSNRSVAAIIPLIKDQKGFDELFGQMFCNDRLIAMRAADAVEKITAGNPAFLSAKEQALLSLCGTATHKELKWHLAQLLPRLDLNEPGREQAVRKLESWALDPAESRIVRVNALQALYNIARATPLYRPNFSEALKRLSAEAIPSISARIRKLRKASYSAGSAPG